MGSFFHLPNGALRGFRKIEESVTSPAAGPPRRKEPVKRRQTRPYLLYAAFISGPFPDFQLPG
jgi:hypothetical protein